MDKNEKQLYISNLPIIDHYDKNKYYSKEDLAKIAGVTKSGIMQYIHRHNHLPVARTGKYRKSLYSADVAKELRQSARALKHTPENRPYHVAYRPSYNGNVAVKIAKKGFADKYALYKKEGLTTDALAEMLGVHPVTASNYVYRYEENNGNNDFHRICDAHIYIDPNGEYVDQREPNVAKQNDSTTMSELLDAIRELSCDVKFIKQNLQKSGMSRSRKRWRATCLN